MQINLLIHQHITTSGENEVSLYLWIVILTISAGLCSVRWKPVLCSSVGGEVRRENLEIKQVDKGQVSIVEG